MLNVIVPSCTDRLILNLLESMERSESGSCRCVIVGDNGLSADLTRFGVTRVSVPTNPFVHMRALNLMISACNPEADIVVMGDDCAIVTDGWLSATEDLLKNWPVEYGMLNFQLGGGANPVSITPSEWTLPLLGSVIPRSVLSRVGSFDERFIGYGYDDVDYSMRMLHAGLLLGTTAKVGMTHEGQATYTAKRHLIDHEGRLNRWLLALKWNIPSDFHGHLRAGDHFNMAACQCTQAEQNGAISSNWERPGLQ